jgi:hypothetical protein
MSSKKSGQVQIAEFKFNKRGQLLIRVHNETLSIVPMRVSNKDRSPFKIHGCDTTARSTGFPMAEQST